METGKRDVLMKEGIIVVDKIPKNCRNIKGDKYVGCPFGGMVCQITQKDVMSHVVKGTKPEWCPIKQIPEKKMCSMSICIDKEEYNKRKGWNECVDQLLNG